MVPERTSGILLLSIEGRCAEVNADVSLDGCAGGVSFGVSCSRGGDRKLRHMEADEILEQLNTRVSPERREVVQDAYTRAAKNGTAAFLTCYFLGLVGAHRLYLGDWRGAALRLLVPIGLALVAVAGILDVLPVVAALALAAGVLLIGLV